MVYGQQVFPFVVVDRRGQVEYVAQSGPGGLQQALDEVRAWFEEQYYQGGGYTVYLRTESGARRMQMVFDVLVVRPVDGAPAMERRLVVSRTGIVDRVFALVAQRGREAGCGEFVTAIHHAPTGVRAAGRVIGHGAAA